MKVRSGDALVLLLLSSQARRRPGGQTANTLRALARFRRAGGHLADMKWLRGHWKGTGLGGVSEEIVGRAGRRRDDGQFRWCRRQSVGVVRSEVRAWPQSRQAGPRVAER